MLQQAGATSVIVSNGVECLNALEDDVEYHVILMDIQMPILDGVATTLKIREMADTAIQQIPIVALTANVMQQDVDKYLTRGMNSHVAKPINKELMIEAVKALVKM